MSRNDLTNIINIWRSCLITEMEYRLSLSYAIQGRAAPVSAAIRRVAELREAGIVG